VDGVPEFGARAEPNLVSRDLKLHGLKDRTGLVGRQLA
jgi:hypothetical protein